MKKKLLKGLLYILLGYLLLVALHFIYLELGGEVGRAGIFAQMEYKAKAESFELMAGGSSVRNYASVALPTLQQVTGEPAQSVEQKYEKVGSLNTSTTKFAEDEKLTRATVKAHNALIQEEAVNNFDNRNLLRLTIGVPPGEFDVTIADLKKIGKVEDFQVTKTDKTNDFLQLRAKRITLEKARDSLISLKTMGGKIEELVKVEQEILSLEGKIQELGVQLGQFDKVNEFCTVRFNLAEKPVEVVRSPHLGYLIDSLQWASTVYLTWLGIAFVGLSCVVLILLIIEKSKMFGPAS